MGGDKAGGPCHLPLTQSCKCSLAEYGVLPPQNRDTQKYSPAYSLEGNQNVPIQFAHYQLTTLCSVQQTKPECEAEKEN